MHRFIIFSITLFLWSLYMQTCTPYLLHIFIFYYLFILLKDKCFTEFCFLSNLNMNQPQVYIYPLPFEPPSHLSWSHSLQVNTEPLFHFPEPYSKFLLDIYFSHSSVSFQVTCSTHSTLSSLLLMSISLFPMSVAPLLACK